MDVDDEFGDLYADIGPEIGKNPTAEPLVGEDDGDLYDEDDEELLYGTSSSSLLTLSSKPTSLPASTPRRSGIQLPLTAKEVDHDELLLYGQLYGVSEEKPLKVESPLRSGEIKATSLSRPEKRQDSREAARSIEIAVESSFDLLVDDRATSAGDMLGRSSDIPLGVVAMTGGSGEKAVENDDATSHGRMLEGLGNRSLPPDSETSNLRRGPLVNESTRQTNSPPGLSSTVHVQPDFIPEEEEEGHEMVDEWEGGVIEGGEEALEGEGDDWDSDSEDDIQIVLNDETPMYAGERLGDVGEVEGSEDEDEDEDLVIVAGDDDAPMEEQEWEEQAMPMDSLPGALGANLASGSDRALGGEDRGQGGKGSGGPGVGPGVPRIGYSGQGYHAHHMQYKYVRPGAGASSGTAPQPNQGSPQAGVPSGRGIAGGSLGGWGPGRGVAGRGDWAGGSGRGSAGQRPSQGPGGMTSWGASRGFSSGIEFNLPPTKTVFDVDLDSLEEKPWRRPGVDITDYFNFSFTENSWKQYCRQLAQLRLEATMQSKIRVYESGRSEQEYDPDLPPELAAATGLQEASGDPNLPQQRQQDAGLGAGSGRGRGLGRGRMMPPAGRAIQVEGGGGERRPSADVRRQRSRDSDAVIQIVLQDASEDEPPASVPGNEGNDDYQEEDEDRGAAVLEKERRFYRSGPSAPWDMEGPPTMWERENMPMGLGPMPNMMPLHGGGMMPGHRMDVEGPGPFPVGPAMPMHQPGPGLNFGMFPGAPFGPPPVGRAGMVRPPLYNAPRPGLPLPVPVPPQDGFPPMMVPLEYHEPPRRRTPPHLTPPRRTPPRGLPGDWDDDLSNSSGANWNIREGRSHRGNKDLDGGNGDWHADDVERRGSNYPVRRGRETDRLSLRERSVDEASAEGRSEEHKRSISRDRHLEDSDWESGHSMRIAKKQKVQQQVDTRVKAGREEYGHSKPLKSNARKEEPSYSWEPTMERLAIEEDISQQRRYDVIHSKASELKGPSHGEDSLSSQRKEFGWSDRQDRELKDRRRPREKDEVHRRKMKEDDTRQHRNREDLERERRREDQERDRRHLRKDKEEERFIRDDRSKRHVEDHAWASREPEETRAQVDVKSVSTEREPEHSKEKRKREEDRVKLKNRLDDFRETDGRLKGRLEDLRENDGRGKGRLDDRRESDERLKGRFEGVREMDGRAKGRLEGIRDVDGRGKGRLEDVREIDGQGKGRLEIVRDSDGRATDRLEDVRESEGRSKGRLEDLRESNGRGKGRLEDVRESDERVKRRLEDGRERDGRGKSRLEDVRETDGRAKVRLEDLRENDGRLITRLEDHRESDDRMRLRLEDLRDSEGRVRRRSEDPRESDGRVKSRLEDVREGDGRPKGQVEDVRENDGRVKRRMEDVRENDLRGTGRFEDPRESDGRGKVSLDEGRENDGRGRRYDKEDAMHSWDDQQMYEEKSTRGESTHAAQNYSVELRKLSNDQHPHKDKRGWEGNVTTKETTSERNGSLSGLGEDKSYRSHTDGSKKRRVEEYRTSSQFDKASTRNSVDLAATSARHKEKKVVVQKRVEDNFAKRTHGKDITSRQHRVSKDDSVLSAEIGSSEEEADRRGRSKLERWTSRKERDANAAMGGESLKKWQISDSGREEPSLASEYTISERKQQSRAEQHWKEESKEKQRLTHSGKRRLESEVKEPSAARGGGDTALEPTTTAPKDAAEKRKERLERMRLQVEEEAAKRWKNEASLPQAGSVEEVKQERPARKRRWGNS